MGAAASNAPSATTSLRGRVLLVDDDDALVRSFARALTRDGYDVDIAHTGEDALQAFDGGGYHVVVSDIALVRKIATGSPRPKAPLSGMKSARKISAVSRTATCATILLSAFTPGAHAISATPKKAGISMVVEGAAETS